MASHLSHGVRRRAHPFEWIVFVWFVSASDMPSIATAKSFDLLPGRVKTFKMKSKFKLFSHLRRPLFGFRDQERARTYSDEFPPFNLLNDGHGRHHCLTLSWDCVYASGMKRFLCVRYAS